MLGRSANASSRRREGQEWAESRRQRQAGPGRGAQESVEDLPENGGGRLKGVEHHRHLGLRPILPASQERGGQAAPPGVRSQPRGGVPWPLIGAGGREASSPVQARWDAEAAVSGQGQDPAAEQGGLNGLRRTKHQPTLKGQRAAAGNNQAA